MTQIKCPRCGIVTNVEPDGCRDPSCPLLYGDWDTTQAEIQQWEDSTTRVNGDLADMFHKIFGAVK